MLFYVSFSHTYYDTKIPTKHRHIFILSRPENLSTLLLKWQKYPLKSLTKSDFDNDFGDFACDFGDFGGGFGKKSNPSKY